ncbi:MAG: class I SAM-dependent methyltransferase [Spirochaetaceae bacterium]|nr:class I SAM-dependent methyltransferase [Spirochaetaceae bacterium]
MSFTDNFGNPKGLLGRMMLVTMEKEHLPMAKWAFPQLNIPADGEILEIGCGGGYNIRRILEASKNAKVVGIDISEESVRKAKKINKAELGKRCEILQGNVGQMPFKDGQFDFATAFETVFFWPNLPVNLLEVFRVIKAGGRFAVINNYGDPAIDWEKKVPCMKRYTVKEIQNFMEAAGFKIITQETKDNLFLVIGEKQKCC